MLDSPDESTGLTARADVVGSLLRPAELLEAAEKKVAAGEISVPQSSKRPKTGR